MGGGRSAAPITRFSGFSTTDNKLTATEPTRETRFSGKGSDEPPEPLPPPPPPLLPLPAPEPRPDGDAMGDEDG